MFNHRRSEMEIVRDILTLSQNGAKKTEILYRVNLSYHQLQNYLSYSLEKEILELKIVENDNQIKCKIYCTTAKGDQLLEDINKTLSYFE